MGRNANAETTDKCPTGEELQIGQVVVVTVVVVVVVVVVAKTDDLTKRAYCSSLKRLIFGTLKMRICLDSCCGVKTFTATFILPSRYAGRSRQFAPRR